jgi:hypothetical protein
MTLGGANKQGDLFDDVMRFCDRTLDKDSIYAFCTASGTDLLCDGGRRSVPPSVVACAMVLQRLKDSRTGFPEIPPVRPGVFVSDYLTRAMALTRR